MTQIWAERGLLLGSVFMYQRFSSIKALRWYPINHFSNWEVMWHSNTLTGRIRLWLLWIPNPVFKHVLTASDYIREISLDLKAVLLVLDTYHFVTLYPPNTSGTTGKVYVSSTHVVSIPEPPHLTLVSSAGAGQHPSEDANYWLLMEKLNDTN